MLLPERGPAAAKELLDDLHARSATPTFAHGEQVTISAGIAVFPDMADATATSCCTSPTARCTGPRTTARRRTCVYSKGIDNVRRPSEIAEQAERHARLRAAESLIRDRRRQGHLHRPALPVGQPARRGHRPHPRARREDGRAAAARRRCCTTSARSRCPTTSCRSPASSTPTSSRCCASIPSSATSCSRALGVAPVDAWVRHHHEFVGRQRLPARPARARRSRSARASSWSPTPSTR